MTFCDEPIGRVIEECREDTRELYATLYQMYLDKKLLPVDFLKRVETAPDSVNTAPYWLSMAKRGDITKEVAQAGLRLRALQLERAETDIHLRRAEETLRLERLGAEL